MIKTTYILRSTPAHIRYPVFFCNKKNENTSVSDSTNVNYMYSSINRNATDDLVHLPSSEASTRAGFGALFEAPKLVSITSIVSILSPEAILLGDADA